MSFIKIFSIITIGSLILLIYSWYKDYQFDNNPLSKDISQKIAAKKFEIKRLIKNKYQTNIEFDLIVTNKMNSNLFGLASYDVNTNEIKIYLNKKRFKESLDYMIEDVMPHEYAHALMFSFGSFSNKNSGHTVAWQKICKNLNGKRCDRFVNHNDILIGKTKLPF